MCCRESLRTNISQDIHPSLRCSAAGAADGILSRAVILLNVRQKFKERGLPLESMYRQRKLVPIVSGRVKCQHPARKSFLCATNDHRKFRWSRATSDQCGVALSFSLV